LNSEYGARDALCWHGDDLLARFLAIQDLREERKAAHYILKKSVKGGFILRFQYLVSRDAFGNTDSYRIVFKLCSLPHL